MCSCLTIRTVRKASIDRPLMFMTSLTMGFDHIYIASLPLPMEQASDLTQKAGLLGLSDQYSEGAIYLVLRFSFNSTCFLGASLFINAEISFLNIFLIN